MSARAKNKEKTVLTLQDPGITSFYYDRWCETSMPDSAHFRLGQIEQATDTANVLHEILMIDADHSEDAGQHDDVKYRGLNHRQRWSIFSAQRFLLDGIRKDIEDLREEFTRKAEVSNG